MLRILIFVLLLCFASARAQLYSSSRSKLESSYKQLTASGIVKKTAAFGLRGPVKEVQELQVNGNDTNRAVLCFLADGRLHHYRSVNGYQKAGQLYNYSETYVFSKETGRLETYTESGPVGIGGNLVRMFDEAGYAAKDIITGRNRKAGTEDGRIFDHTVQYTWASGHKKVSLHYQYAVKSGQYERTDDYSLQFQLNSRHELVTEIRSEPYGRRIDVVYEPGSNLPLAVYYKQLCYPHNSCMNLQMFYAYDKSGQLLRESRYDMTVRNSNFADTYMYRYEYNYQGDPAVKYYSKAEHFRYAESPLLLLNRDSSYTYPEKRDIVYDGVVTMTYQYEKMGNWIHRTDKDKHTGQTTVYLRTISYH